MRRKLKSRDYSSEEIGEGEGLQQRGENGRVGITAVRRTLKNKAVRERKRI